MFKETFKHIVSGFNSEPVLVNKLLNEIESKYSSASRYYHNMSHLDHLIRELHPVKKQIEDWQTIVLSVAYHDIVYNPLKKDNEEKSAAVAAERLGQLNLPEDQIEKCRKQIISTGTHALSDKLDTNYLTDADLSILGSAPESYSEYTRQVRQEYKYFPNLIYKPGRKKVLMRFLEMPTIFKTNHFRDKYEAQARINLAKELKALS